MDCQIGNMRPCWANTPWWSTPGDSDNEQDVPVLVHRMRRKSFYVRFPDALGSPYAPVILRMGQKIIFHRALPNIPNGGCSHEVKLIQV